MTGRRDTHGFWELGVALALVLLLSGCDHDGTGSECDPEEVDSPCDTETETGDETRSMDIYNGEFLGQRDGGT